MPTKLTAPQVLEWATELENDPEHQAYLLKMRDREALHSMRMPARLTEKQKQAGPTSELPSPSLIFLSQVKRAKWLTFDTHVTIFNRDGTTQADREKADELEKRAVICLGQLNEGNTWFQEMYSHLLLSSYSVTILHCGEDDLDDDWAWPYSVEMPDPKTCFFPIQGGAFRPPVMARTYSMAVREVEKQYSGKSKKGPLEGAHIRFNAGTKRFEKFSDDHEAEVAVTNWRRSRKDGLQILKFVWLADGDYIYHIVEGEDVASSEMLWVSEERTGGVPAVVAPGMTTPIRGVGNAAGERLAPLFWPIYAAVNGLNEIRARRITMSDVVTNPDRIVESENAGVVDAERLTGLTSMESSPAVAQAGGWWSARGQVVAMPGQHNPDLDKLEISWKEDLDFYVNAHMDISRPELAAESTANVQLQQVEAKGRLDSESLGNADFVKKTILEMLFTAHKSYDRDLNVVAQRDMKYGQQKKVERGNSYTLSKTVLDFKYVVNVETESVTAQERRLKTEIANENYLAGWATAEEVLDTMYDNPSEQWEKLARDEGIRYLEGPMGAFSEQKLNQIAMDLAYLEGGIILPQGNGLMAGEETGNSNGGGGNVQGAGSGRVPTMEAPVVRQQAAGGVGTGP